MTSVTRAKAPSRLLGRARIGRGVAFFVLAIAAIAFLMPLYWMVVNSFQKTAAILSPPIELWPVNGTFDNYARLFDVGALDWSINSVIVSLGGMIVAIACALPTGYGFARKEFPGKRVLFAIVLVSMMMPWAVRLIPSYLLMADLGLINTHLGIFIVEAAFPLGIFFARQFYQSQPAEVFDAAHVDGTGEFRTFWSIALPMSTPLIGVLAITAFFGTWTNYVWQLVMASESLYTLPVGVASRAAGLIRIDWGLQMAGTTLALLPLLIIFLAFQRYFVQGVTFGAVNE